MNGEDTWETVVREERSLPRSGFDLSLELDGASIIMLMMGCE